MAGKNPHRISIGNKNSRAVKQLQYIFLKEIKNITKVDVRLLNDRIAKV